MTKRSYIICVLLMLFAAAGCKVRTISQGKPPRDGVFKRNIVDPKYGTLHTEEHYQDGVLKYVKGNYRNGVRAFERFKDANRDSSIWFFPSGPMNYCIVSINDRVMSFRELYESGAVKLESDTSVSREYYPGGEKNCTIRYKDGLVVSIERWYENGRRQELSEWLNDQRHGRRFEWDETGKQTVKEYYVNGERSVRRP
jgi:antitoxin component YwqK of YwqJK toxin-antitoxin module